VGLLDYYRQFDDVDQEEFNKGLRERRAREKALALERVEVLDLSGTEWPEMPNSEVANAAIYAVRGNINGYPDRFATSCSNRRRTCCSAAARSSSRRGRPTPSTR
jgi:uncharacterized membrane protein